MTIPGPARIKALTDAELPEDILNNEALNKVNVIRTFANHPAAFKPWNRLAAYVMSRSELDVRHREMVFLRTGWNHQSDYEFGQHRIIGGRAGLTEEEILNIAHGPEVGGPDALGWAAEDKVLLKAVDELFATSDITDDTWAELGNHYNDLQKVDIIIGVGQYTLVCMLLKSVRVQLDDNIGGLPDIEGSRPARGPYGPST